MACQLDATWTCRVTFLRKTLYQALLPRSEVREKKLWNSLSKKKEKYQCTLHLLQIGTWLLKIEDFISSALYLIKQARQVAVEKLPWASTNLSRSIPATRIIVISYTIPVFSHTGNVLYKENVPTRFYAVDVLSVHAKK